MQYVQKVGISDRQKWIKEVLESNKTLFLCFSLCMYIYVLWQGQKVVLTIAEFEFVDIGYSKLEKYRYFPSALNFVLKIDFFAFI